MLLRFSQQYYMMYMMISLLVVVLLVLGGAMYYCNNKDHPHHPMSALMTLLVPGLGQIASRMFVVSGGKGMAQKWLLFPLFFIPPFTAVPAWYVYNDMEVC